MGRLADGPPSTLASTLDSASASTASGTGASDSTKTDAVEARRRQRGLIVAGIGAVMMLAVGWLVFGRGDGAADLESTAKDSVPTETDVLDSLPFAVSEPAEADTDDGPDEADDESDDGSDGDVDDDAPKTGTSDNSAQWRQGTVDLPQVLLDSTAAFELVALTSEGDFVQVAVPSGAVDRVEIESNIDGRVVAGETAALFVSYSSTRGGRLLRAGEPSLELSLPSNVDISQVGASGDEFAGVSYGNGGEQQLVRIMADGGVVTTDPDDAEVDLWQRRFTADGSPVITEAGGVYIGTDSGFERISSGYLISASTHHLLVRECDAEMTCGYATIEFDTGERVPVVIEDDSLGRFGFDSAQVSPDGRWLRYVAFDGTSSDEIIIDLTTGVRTDLDFANFGRSGQDGKVWAADSSGFFRTSLEPGLEFYEVATGETFRFGEELGRITSFDIRSTPGRSAQVPLTAVTSTGISLVALTAAGDVAQIDVDSGAVITTDGPGMDSSAPVTIFPDAAGATFTSYDNVPSFRFVADEGTVLQLQSTGPGGPIWPGPYPGTVWQTGEGTDGTTLALELVNTEGDDLDARIAFDEVGLNGIIGSDGRFGVVVEPKLGGVFALDASNPPEWITSGELLAINATVAYVRECDDSFQCGVFAVERESGDRTLMTNGGFDRAGDIASRAVPSGQNVSPDGTIAFVRDGEDPTRCLMIDTTASGEGWTGVPCVDTFGPTTWTPDSAYAVWLGEGRVTVYERATRSIRIVNTPELKAIAAAPADDAPAGDAPASGG